MARIRTTNHFDAWFNKLRDPQAKARIQVRIDRLAGGSPGQHRKLTHGVQEMKISYGPGYRVYFTERAGEIIILLCGGDKKTQAEDIRLAIHIADVLEH
jgi:putative addiction module killer protein